MILAALVYLYLGGAMLAFNYIWDIRGIMWRKVAFVTFWPVVVPAVFLTAAIWEVSRK